VSYLFYAAEHIRKEELNSVPVNPHYKIYMWRPSSTRIVPLGISFKPFFVWWLFHQFRIFANHDFAIFLIYDGIKLIHRSGVFPGYFRFPFMEKDDLQIGDIWTHASHRGKGLATYAIQQILKHFIKPGRRFWYIVEKNNLPSIVTIEKAGFSKVGEGNRIKRFGLSILGVYNIQKYYVDESQTI